MADSPRSLASDQSAAFAAVMAPKVDPHARLLLLPNLEQHVANFPHECLPDGTNHLVCTLYTVVRIGIALPEELRANPPLLSSTISLHNAATGEEITSLSRSAAIMEKRAKQRTKSIATHGEEKARKDRPELFTDDIFLQIEGGSTTRQGRPGDRPSPKTEESDGRGGVLRDQCDAETTFKSRNELESYSP